MPENRHWSCQVINAAPSGPTAPSLATSTCLRRRAGRLAMPSPNRTRNLATTSWVGHRGGQAGGSRPTPCRTRARTTAGGHAIGVPLVAHQRAGTPHRARHRRGRARDALVPAAASAGTRSPPPAPVGGMADARAAHGTPASLPRSAARPIEPHGSRPSRGDPRPAGGRRGGVTGDGPRQQPAAAGRDDSLMISA